MDEYTPHGYLDNPWHGARLHPSGVVRSHAALGFAWHYPSQAGPYCRRQLYAAGLRLALRQGDSFLLASEDFSRAGIAVVSPHHSKNIICYATRLGSTLYSASFFLAAEHALCCLLSLANEGTEPTRVEWAFVADYERNIASSDAWDCGLLARWREETRSIALLAYPEGEAFVCAADSSPISGKEGEGVSTDPASHFLATSPSGLLASINEGLDLTYALAHSGRAAVYGALLYRAVLQPGEHCDQLAVLGRGLTEREARSAMRMAVSLGRHHYVAKHAEDEQFRLGCLKLSGDWPAHWRRGLVYDAETLRSLARRPQGIFRRPWDGMQLQAPRLVLAEAAFDALLLSYADPDLAQRIIWGAFADAVGPNVPCTREDGSLNMVAEDGTPCGTAPEWCWPLYCVDLLYRRTADRAWLAKLFPYLARYLDWWLRHRADEEGWLHYHCSWESGQDESPRFGEQTTGGSLIGHIRPVDLHAAVAQGAAILARFAAELGKSRRAVRWQQVAGAYRAKTQLLWRDDWFYDYDTRAGRPVPFRDAMHLAPLVAGVATPGQRTLLRPAFAHLPPHGVWPPLDWPPVVFTVVEAASAVGWHAEAAMIATALAERVYQAYDAGQQMPGMPLPGIASERWATSGSWGCEGYGWGALATLLVARHILGWQEDPDGSIVLHPALPAAWLSAGGSFTAGPLHHRGQQFTLRYDARGDDRLEVSIRWTGTRQVRLVHDETGQPVASLARAAGEVRWPGHVGGSYRVQLAD